MKKLNDIQIRKLRNGDIVPGERTYGRDAVLYYEGHTPHACYLLLKGEIVLSKKNKVREIVTAGHIVGFNNFSDQGPSEFTATIKGNSSVFIIDKSTFFELQESPDFELKKIVS